MDCGCSVDGAVPEYECRPGRVGGYGGLDVIGEVSTWLQTFLRLVSDRVNNLESAQLRKITLFQLEKVLAYVIVT